jgi:hypothetical protein
MKFLCECNSFNCPLSIDIDLDEMTKIKSESDQIIIVDGCMSSPVVGDVKLEERLGYSIWKVED